MNYVCQTSRWHFSHRHGNRCRACYCHSVSNKNSESTENSQQAVLFIFPGFQNVSLSSMRLSAGSCGFQISTRTKMTRKMYESRWKPVKCQKIILILFLGTQHVLAVLRKNKRKKKLLHFTLQHFPLKSLILQQSEWKWGLNFTFWNIRHLK